MTGGRPSHYLEQVAARLRQGLRRLPAGFRERQVRYLRRAQDRDGGFPGRGTGSDLYYTAFALRAADALEVADGELWRGAARYLEQCGPDRGTLVDGLSWMHAADLVASAGRAEVSPDVLADARRVAASLVRSTRAGGGGSSNRPSGPASVYHTFLSDLCLDLLGRAPPLRGRAVTFVLGCRCGDGGFADQPSDPGTQGGTNPTAAAAAFLARHGALQAEVARGAVEFLAHMQRPDGGFAAHATAPQSDLLSSFTALLTLGDLGGIRRVRLAPAGRYVQALLHREGGFRGALPDAEPDVEYTYYGLGTLALLAHESRRAGGRGCACRAESSRRRPA